MPFTGWRRIFPAAFFGLLLLLGLWLHRDYGVSWDEPTDHQNGAVSGRYVAELLLPRLLRDKPTLATSPPITNYPDNDHGVAFELPVAALEMLLTPGDPQYYFLYVAPAHLSYGRSWNMGAVPARVHLLSGGGLKGGFIEVGV
jgi:hypothetical protein